MAWYGVAPFNTPLPTLHVMGTHRSRQKWSQEEVVMKDKEEGVGEMCNVVDHWVLTGGPNRRRRPLEARHVLRGAVPRGRHGAARGRSRRWAVGIGAHVLRPRPTVVATTHYTPP